MLEPNNFREGLAIKARVYDALIVRHILMRYGRDNLGFLWTVVEPMLLCVGVMGIWSITKGGHEHGLQVTALVYTGYMPLTLWRHMTNSMVHWLRFSKFFIQFRGISLLDALLSRLYIEFISVTSAAIIVYFSLNTVGLLPDIQDFGTVLEGWLIMGALGFGGGFLIAAASEATEITEKIMPPLQYFMLPFSGCFFMLSWLPSSAREYLSYVSFVHSFETFRSGFFGSSVETYGNPSYAFAVALATAGCGFIIFERIRDNISPNG
ncbi:capsular polysaccharide transport system permease protein [Bosea sp. BE125]|uniref:ABC transporter permease n=1 Tax=Bosea sp. BE125 TaxID=2817909 RepID=UPI002860422F|nr:ABC transporter permease [Bosea sp. BE125]MDR6874802.1 capsular polysaccharide transport system permease protein [Bosea sp. BE125]